MGIVEKIFLSSVKLDTLCLMKACLIKLMVAIKMVPWAKIRKSMDEHNCIWIHVENTNTREYISRRGCWRKATTELYSSDRSGHLVLVLYRYIKTYIYMYIYTIYTYAINSTSFVSLQYTF